MDQVKLYFCIFAFSYRLVLLSCVFHLAFTHLKKADPTCLLSKMVQSILTGGGRDV